MTQDALPRWTVMRHKGNGSYETVAYSLPASSRENAALVAYEKHRKSDDPETWQLLVLAQMQHITVGLKAVLK